MLILGVEFSSPARSVALIEAAGSEVRVLGTLSDSGSRDARPLPLIRAVLDQAGLETHAVEALAVGLGPGSYTGIRSAIAIGQGWKLARGIALTGVSSVDVLAFQAMEKGCYGDVRIVVDAQRGEVYLAHYRIGPHGREIVVPVRLARPSEIPVQDDGAGRLIGPEVTRWFEGGSTIFPEARVVAQLAAGHFGSGLSDKRLEPIYLRQTSFVKAPKPRKLPA